MSDGTDTATPAAADTGAPAAAAAAAATSAPEWLGGLSEDLRSDATLAKYATLDDFARGHLETKRVASSKAVPLPGDTEESRKAFADALRPESVDAYDFGEVPPVVDSKLVDGFKQFAFDSGLPPHLAKGALDFYAGVMAEQVETANKASLEDLDKFAAEYGSQYDTKLAAVQKMIEDFTGTPIELTDEDMTRLDIKLGSSSLMKFMFAVHDRFGDLAPAGEDALPTGMANIAPENAEAILDTKMKDPAWRKQALVKGSNEQRESERLQKLIAQHRISKQRA